ncbi:hypothetical protein D6829_02255 [Candidatus Pacearchaeota archaeon]|nr:MAG: hypothetical protein D6829_02255 [Candidatus Pacearchaeota archaeon]
MYCCFLINSNIKQNLFKTENFGFSMDKLRILAAGDLHGSADLAERLAKLAKKEKVDLVVLAGDIAGFGGESEEVLKPFKRKRQKICFVPGNWDAFEDLEIFKNDAKSIHHYYVSYKGVGILGVGNPDWKLSLDDSDFELIEKNFKRMKPRKRILVSHLHPKGTRAEFSGFEGDEILRKITEKFQPDILISGHIHEAEGIEDKIGKTRVIQVGRKGKIIEV